MSQGLGRFFFGILVPVALTILFLSPDADALLPIGQAGPSQRPAANTMTGKERAEIWAGQSGKSGLRGADGADASPAPTLAPTPLPVPIVSLLAKGVLFQLINAETGKPLEAPANGAFGGQAMLDTGAGLAGSLWRLELIGGAYRIVHHPSGHCLDVALSGRGSGTAVILWDATGGRNQLWELRGVGREVQIVARHSEHCLDVVAGKAVQNTPSDRASQRWLLRPVFEP